MTEATDQLLRKYAIRNGLLFGAVSLAMSIVSFYLIVDVVRSPFAALTVPYLFSFVFTLVLAIFFCFNLRKTIGGYWTFREATSGIFILFLTAFLIVFIGRDLLFAHLIEPRMNEKMEVIFLNASVQVMKAAKATPEQINAKIKDISEQFNAEKNATTWQKIQGPVISAIMLFVVALIFGALFKRNPPQRLTFEPPLP